MPNIPTQAGLNESEFEPSLVPADDLDGAWLKIRTVIIKLAERFSDARIIADYTGGTKTMSAALVCAALERNDVDLQLVTGARVDLVRVAAGTERAMMASMARLQLNRAMAPYLNAWGRFAYREAAKGLETLPITVNDADSTKLQLALNLSRTLAQWDDFDHVGALALLQPYASRVTHCYPNMIIALHQLTREGNEKCEPMRLFDLWLNAQRRAVQGRYDDAVARVYRLLEWTAQWQLRRRLDFDTADFPCERLPKGMAMRPDRDGKFRLGLWSAWQVIKADTGMAGPAQMFIKEQENKLKDLLAIRNFSILAHGFRPVPAADWQKMQQWVEKYFLPLLRNLASEAGLNKPPEQLPTEFRAE